MKTEFVTNSTDIKDCLYVEGYETDLRKMQ
jgi:hypothetical protein